MLRFATCTFPQFSDKAKAKATPGRGRRLQQLVSLWRASGGDRKTAEAEQLLHRRRPREVAQQPSQLREVDQRENLFAATHREFSSHFLGFSLIDTHSGQADCSSLSLTLIVVGGVGAHISGAESKPNGCPARAYPSRGADQLGQGCLANTGGGPWCSPGLL